MTHAGYSWWASLRHSGLLLDMQRLSKLVPESTENLSTLDQERLRRELLQFQSAPDKQRELQRREFVRFILHKVCGFSMEMGEWSAGSNVDKSWSRQAITGEIVRPAQMWVHHQTRAVLPVFIEDDKQLGIGRGRRAYSRVLQWLRQGSEQLAVLSNGQQWRLIFAGLDYDAYCEWDIEQWFFEGQPSSELNGFLALLSPRLWVPLESGRPSPLLESVNDSRKGQADLSKVLGERVRKAVELLIKAHAPALNEHHIDLDPKDIYRAAVRMVMRLVIILFAESRDGLLPRDRHVYRNSYGLQDLRELLGRTSRHRLIHGSSAWPRILALMRLISQGSVHEAMPVRAYGGELFAPGREDSADGMLRVMHILETSCFGHSHRPISDFQVREMLDLLSRTEVTIRQGRGVIRTMAPVDFSNLDSEYIGILYEGLLDFELRCVGKDEPVVFVAAGNQPALPLSTLEQMSDKEIASFLEKLTKETKLPKSADGDDGDGDDEEEDEPEVEEEGEDVETEVDALEAPLLDPLEYEQHESEADAGADEADLEAGGDERYSLRQRATDWARRACIAARLLRQPKGKKPAELDKFQRELEKRAGELVPDWAVLLPGEWYLVRWGGTRKGSGTFYTRPQLATPTVHRTLRPLAYDPPLAADGQPDTLAPAERWTPKLPAEILNLKVCDPACGSGSFLLAALRFLTNDLYDSMQYHKRFDNYADESILQLIYGAEADGTIGADRLPCRPDEDSFELRSKALLRRLVVERCIYGVDLDPLAVELCRLSLWIETLDASLPLTFLNHKVKCGNSLVGAWFDQFAHYPLMAWEREGGDKSHTNGAHFRKGELTKAIAVQKKQAKAEIIHLIDDRLQLSGVDLGQAQQQHGNAMQALAQIHSYGITQIAERQARHEALLADPGFVRLKEAFDLWCALWFWPLDKLALAPLPQAFAAGRIPEEAWQAVRETAARRRFFHWELEFPDVFNAESEGFDAILGNPPWDISKPNSKEFFSRHDPLYRSLGNQEARTQQTKLFGAASVIEAQWLDYNAYFKAMSNWVKAAAFPFGDRLTAKSDGKASFDFNLGSGRKNIEYHKFWGRQRAGSPGFADGEHAFRHQGGGDINLYKTFLEQAHALLRPQGRLGFIVPSGLYSDFGTTTLRQLFIERCNWEWLFGFENREKIFEIHSSFKFNPVIIQKGGTTQAIRTAFMRRSLSDWEHAEDFVTDYPRAQVTQFSPNSLAILEIQSQRDLEILQKIYSNSVLLGDQGPDGWGIKYATEFHMTNDSKLFPPRTKWEEWGYQPDEYSRWIKGPWRPVSDLWAELGIDPEAPRALDAECASAIDAGLKSGEVGRTDWKLRCAQPPYDRLPIPRADIPAGIILSRHADVFIHEDDIPIVSFTEANGKPLNIKHGRGKDKREHEVQGKAVAFPVYVGKMVSNFDFSEHRWLSGTGRSAIWQQMHFKDKVIDPDYLMGASCYYFWPSRLMSKLGFMRVSTSTHRRSMMAAYLPSLPCSHLVPVLASKARKTVQAATALVNSYPFDFVMKRKMGYLDIPKSCIDEMPFPKGLSNCNSIRFYTMCLSCANWIFAADWTSTMRLLEHRQGMQTILWALSDFERVRIRAILDACIMLDYSLQKEDVLHLYEGCGLLSKQLTVASKLGLDQKGFWRVDKDKHPEHRLTVLSLVAFHDLLQHVERCGGDRESGIAAFMAQNNGEGWLLPETLRLADYGLGHDERALEHQPVRACFGPRFYDWQLAQSAEESWRECHLHARNLLGAEGYARLLEEIETGTAGSDDGPGPADSSSAGRRQPFDKLGRGLVFTPEETGSTPLFEAFPSEEDSDAHKD